MLEQRKAYSDHYVLQAFVSARAEIMKRFINWLSSTFSPRKAAGDSALKQSGVRHQQAVSKLRRESGHTVARPAKPRQAVPRRQPEFVDIDPHCAGRIEDRGPGKNVLIRGKQVREDAGTHDTLTILDDSMLESEGADGFDPYNTGQFDRSKNWNRRTK